MKIPGLLKTLNLIALLFILNQSVFGQSNFLRPDAKKDPAWIEQLLTNANRQEISNKDTNRIAHKWLRGKVLYCADDSLKATQLIAAPDTFSTIIQYLHQGKIIEQRFNYTDLSNYVLNKIHRLPGKEPAYLFLLSKTDYQPDYEQDWLKDFDKLPNPPHDMDFKHIKKLNYVAVVLTLKKDSLVEAAFPASPTDSDDNGGEDTSTPVDSTYMVNATTNADTNSFGFTSDIKQKGKWLRPFLKYDTLAHKLSFLNTYCKQDDDDKECTHPFLSVEAGAYLYKDTAFVLTSDTSYYYPSLPYLDAIVARQNYKVGKYLIKAEAVEGYEDGYGGIVHKTLTQEYHIGTQTLTAFNNEDWGEIDLKPDCRLQPNSSLIMLLENETNGYGPGACGSGSHFDSDFMIVDGKSSKKLFSFSTSSCNSNVDYTLLQDGEEISDKFYLIGTSNQTDDTYEFDGSYWKNNSTYVFTVSDSEKLLSRNFYLHFNVLNKKNPVSLKAGKLYKKKKSTSK
jgi:hypothetical protein